MNTGDKVPNPSPVEIIALDDELADLGIPVFDRPFEAAKLWGKRNGGEWTALEKEEFFRLEYRNLHPSVPFDADSFLTLCVSARGVSYFIRPPMTYGRTAIKPIEYTSISKFEISRLWHDHPNAFWEMQWQGFDATDLFMSLVNFHSKDLSAQNMMRTAVNQLTASARQLVACEIDSSLPQGIAMAAELAGKATYLHLEGKDALRDIGHDLQKLASKVADLKPSPVDASVAFVANQLPEYVKARYNSPAMTIAGAQDLYRKAMFFVADMLRRTNHAQGYWQMLESDMMPNRSFE